MAWNFAGDVEIDALCQSRRVALVDQAARNWSEIGIAQPLGAISEGKFHGFGNHVGAIHCVHLGDVKILDDVENLRHVHAAGARRRKADDAVISITGNHRLSSFRFVVGKIRLCDQPPVFVHPRHSTFLANSPR